MTLFHIAIFLLVSLFAGGFIPQKNRINFFVIANILAIFWLQPTSSIRHLDFWLPFVGLFLTMLAWFSTHPSFGGRKTWLSLAVITLEILIICLLRYFEPVCCITASRPPTIIQLITIILPLVIILIILFRFFPSHKGATMILGVIILGLFIILKTDIFSLYLSKLLRMITAQDQSLANSLDLRWTGFSYLAFRLLHYLRDHQSGKIPSHHLNEFIAYALFFPAYTAGPIERFPRWQDNFHCSEENKSTHWHLSSDDFSQGSFRVVIGIFKKFVLADTLAIISLNSQNAFQIKSSFWAWLILYAYAFRIYFDFSGYTDIAIGMARYMGIQLPENFIAPYTKPNLTLFWNSWHITLAQWFRAYVFNPLTRSMRTTKVRFPTWSIIISAQLCTMILIGLWHGVTVNFAVWGLWHAIGLFLHNRWSDWRKGHTFSWENNARVKNLFSFCSWFLTFNYVVLGWVWFALPNPQMTWRVFEKLFGVN